MFKKLGLAAIGVSLGVSAAFADDFSAALPALEALQQGTQASKAMPQAPATTGLSIAYRYVDDGGPYGSRKKVDYQLIVANGQISKLRLGKSPKSAALSAAQLAELTQLAAAVTAAKPESLVQRNSNMLRGITATFTVGDGAGSFKVGLDSSDQILGALSDLFLAMERDERADLGGLRLLWNHLRGGLKSPAAVSTPGQNVSYSYSSDDDGGCSPYDDECAPPDGSDCDPQADDCAP